MSNTLPQHNPELRKIWDTVFRMPLSLQRESSLFLIVSVLDVLMTSLLLEDLTGVTGRTIFYDVAGQWLGGKIDDAAAVAALADNLRVLADAWRNARRARAA